MRNPRDAPRVIGSTAAIPYHLCDDGHPMVGDHDDLHAVGEVERAYLRLSARAGYPEEKNPACCHRGKPGQRTYPQPASQLPTDVANNGRDSEKEPRVTGHRSGNAATKSKMHDGSACRAASW